MKGLKTATWLALALILPMRETRAGKMGLVTRLSDINLAGLDIGGSYNIRTLKNLAYIVQNTSDFGVDMEVDVKPAPKETLKEGYEELPDPSWIKVFPERFHLEAGASSFCELIITIPNDPKWKGRHYQGLITARMVGTGALAVAVTTRLYFSTGPGPAPAAKARMKEAAVPDFELSPESINLGDLEPGRKINVKKERHASVKIINKSDVPFGMAFKVVPFDSNHRPPADFEEAPSSATLTLSKETFKVKTDSIQDLSFTLALPADAYGKRYAFLIKGEMLDIGVPIETYVTVLATAKQKGEK